MKKIVLVMVCFVFICCLYEMVDSDESDKIRSTNKRRFYSTKEELELTKADPRIDAKPCNDKHPLSVFILSAGRSSGQYFERRVAQRNSWVPELKSLNITVYFAIGLHLNESINEELKEESDKYQDMIQFSFIDDYYNLTIKTISILRWVNKKCLSSSYILKVDDDVVINSRLLLDKLSEFKTGISGTGVTCNDVPNRDPNHPWAYTPYECYPNDTLPCYLRGGGYMMGGNITHILIEAFERFPYCVLQTEDVFLTGILLETSGIPRLNSSLIKELGCTDVCPLFETAVIFDCDNAKQQTEYWSKWKTTSYQSCYTPETKWEWAVIAVVLILFVVLCSFLASLVFKGEATPTFTTISNLFFNRNR